MAQAQLSRAFITQNCEASLGISFAPQTPRLLRGRIAPSLLLALLSSEQPSMKAPVTLCASVCVDDGGGGEWWV